MKSKFTLLARINRNFLTVEVKRGKFIEPPGNPRYYVRFTEEGKRHCEALGSHFAHAVAKVQAMELRRDAIRRGLTLPADLVESLNPVEKLRDRIEAYLEEVKANKSRKTWLAYRSSLSYYFTKSCQRISAQAITRDDLLNFKVMLRNEVGERSVYNHFLNVMIFLKWAKVKIELRKVDWPDKPKREPEEYTEKEIDALLNAANPEERLVLNSFLCSGLRSGELAHLTYGDINFNHSIWTVRPKLGWKTKTKESQRDVPIPPWLMDKIKERMKDKEKLPGDLVFPNTHGHANDHLIRVVKKVAKLANVTGRVDDHKFRSTAITRWLRAGHPVPTVMKWVGHIDPATLLRYAAKANLQDPDVHRKATAPFDRFEGVGD